MLAEGLTGGDTRLLCVLLLRMKCKRTHTEKHNKSWRVIIRRLLVFFIIPVLLSYCQMQIMCVCICPVFRFLLSILQ